MMIPNHIIIIKGDLGPACVKGVYNFDMIEVYDFYGDSETVYVKNDIQDTF